MSKAGKEKVCIVGSGNWWVSIRLVQVDSDVGTPGDRPLRELLVSRTPKNRLKIRSDA